MAAESVPTTPAAPTTPAGPTTPTGPATGRPAAPTLREVVDRLERVLAPLGWDQAPIAVGIEPDGDVELAVPPLDCADPIGALVGIDAKASWSAYGIVTSGRVHDLVEEGGRAHGRRRPVEQRARIGHVVDRSGGAVSYVHVQGQRRRWDDGPAVGRVDDVCRRALGLATPPPTVPIGVLWATWWLERVLGDAVDGRIATWADAAALHPVTSVGAVPIVGALGVAPTPATFGAAARRLAAEWCWEDLRGIVATGGGGPVEPVAPDAAAWMDAGMFSRWMLMDEPPLALLREVAVERLPAPVADALDVALAAWGLP